MKERRIVFALVAFTAALSGCGSEISDDTLGSSGSSNSSAAGPNGSGGAGPNGSGGAGSTVSSSAGTGNGAALAGNGSSAGGIGGAPVVPDTGVCVPGVPPSTQIPRLKRAAYINAVRDLLGVSVSKEQLPEDASGNLTETAWETYRSSAETIAAQVMASPESKAKFISCDPAQPACLTNTIKTFGRKAFRRELRADEVTLFEAFGAIPAEHTPADVAEAILYGFLASPSFLLIPELEQERDTATGAIKLSQQEIATRLSFLLWDSIPDDTLNAAADRGELATTEQIRAQAARMIKSEKATGAIAAFHRAYTGNVPNSRWEALKDHDASVYKNFTPAAYAPSIAEIDSFFADIVLRGGAIKDLFLSNIGFVNRDTAPLYGLDASKFGPELQRVELDATERPGFLTRVGFLGTHSHYDSSSPILRGAFVSGRVLGIDPGNPIDGADKQKPPEADYQTTREYFEALTEVPGSACAGCHGKVINPAGFVLERYDSVGTWQDTDAVFKGPIDSTATVFFTQTTSKTVSSPAEMMAEIATLDNVKQRYAEQWVVYATGRSMNDNDRCVVNTLTDRAKTSATYPIADLISDYFQADSFRLRTVGN